MRASFGRTSRRVSLRITVKNTGVRNKPKKVTPSIPKNTTVPKAWRISAPHAGYEVYVVVDASGSMNPDVQNAALMRMSNAGATIGTWFAISCELLYDWRNPTGQGSAQLFVEHFPRYAEIFNSHKAQASPAGDKKK